jgi:integrase/recombinase XerD
VLASNPELPPVKSKKSRRDGLFCSDGRRTWDALQFLAEGKDPDDRIIAITDERIRQILTAAAEAAGLKKKLSPHWLRHAHGSHAHQRGAPAATIRDTLGHASLSTTDLYLSSAPTDGSSLYLQF